MKTTTDSRADSRAIKTSDLRLEAFPEVEQGFRVIIAESALDRCVERGSADMTREIGGILVGEILKDASGPYIRVDDTIDALHADEKGAELTFTHETWDHINKEMDSKFANKKIVGWYHTHPGFGVFLSDRDEFIHSSFFDLPFQIALVYDPKSREQGVFAWKEGHTERMGRYWIGAQEHLFTPPTQTFTEEPPQKVAAKAVSQEVDYGRVDWSAVATLGMIALLIGGFVGWWFGSGSRVANEQQNRAELLEARLIGSQDAVKSLNLRVMSAVQAGFDTQLTSDALWQIGAELDEAAHALFPKNKPEANHVELGAQAEESPKQRLEKAHRRVQRAKTVVSALASDRQHVKVTLTELDMLANKSRDQIGRKELSMHLGALATLYADLSVDAKKSGDEKRAARYMELAKKLDPRNGSRKGPTRHHLNHGAKGMKR